VAGRLFTDTTEFFSIDYGDIIEIGKKQYRVVGHLRETRFGMEDPKFWVKKTVDLETGKKKIVKLSFFESFETTLGGVKILCFRDPAKEGKILDLIKDHPYFMHGTSHLDEKGNNIRVLDIVPGPNFFVYIDSFSMGYETYFRTILPDILRKLAKAFDAIRFLHVQGFRHGDIRNDHIIVERLTGNYVWIDFDYDYDASENPFGLDIFGLGNVLLYAVGKGFHNLYMIKHDTFVYGDLLERLDPKDFSILDKWRFLNLRKIYPFIPVALNNILMHFSRGANVYYEFVEEIIEDLNRCIHLIYE
jgi:hypothetical protein